MALETGSIIQKRYQIRGQISRGGFGDIYLASDLAMSQRVVVVKQGHSTNIDVQNAMLEESKLMHRVRHRGLPEIYDSFIDTNRHVCLVMQYIPGVDFERLLKQGPQPTIEVAIAWTIQILEILAELHSQEPPIIHRDVKFSNLIYGIDGQIHLLDLGIAKSGSRTTVIAATPPFAPPEQYQRIPTTCASDVYAVGVILYRFLTGEEPPESIGLLRGIHQLQRPRAIKPDIPESLESIVLKAMQLDSEQRYLNGMTMLTALHIYTEEEYISRSSKRISRVTRRLYSRNTDLKERRLDGNLVRARMLRSTRRGRSNIYNSNRIFLSIEPDVMQSSEESTLQRDASAIESSVSSQNSSAFEQLSGDIRFPIGAFILLGLSMLIMRMSPLGVAMSLYVIIISWGVYPILALLFLCWKTKKIKINIRNMFVWLVGLWLYTGVIHAAALGIIALQSLQQIVNIISTARWFLFGNMILTTVLWLGIVRTRSN